jgi:hypothetical protein
MVRVRRHLFAASDVTDWRGDPVGCRHCPLPADNDVHGVQLPTEEQMAAVRRRVGDRE